jgi:hypothetical protein
MSRVLVNRRWVRHLQHRCVLARGRRPISGMCAISSFEILAGYFFRVSIHKRSLLSLVTGMYLIFLNVRLDKTVRVIGTANND